MVLDKSLVRAVTWNFYFVFLAHNMFGEMSKRSEDKRLILCPHRKFERRGCELYLKGQTNFSVFGRWMILLT